MTAPTPDAGRSRGLKLYVWEDVLCDYTCGVIFALARDVREARRLAIAAGDDYGSAVADAVEAKPKVYTAPHAGFVWGGG